MSYLGWTHAVCQQHLSRHVFPKILEIGVHYGQTTLPLVQNLAHGFEKFLYVGVDIWIRPQLDEQLSQFSDINIIIHGRAERSAASGRDVILFEENSLDWLTSQTGNTKFDVVFLDGDHNYQTVFQELNLIQSLLKPASILVCDDYNGKWAEKDQFYSAKDEYESVKIATPYDFSEKQGVRTAIDEFVNNNVDRWRGLHRIDLEPIILFNPHVYEAVEISSTNDVWKTLKNRPFPIRRLRA